MQTTVKVHFLDELLEPVSQLTVLPQVMFSLSLKSLEVRGAGPLAPTLGGHSEYDGHVLWEAGGKC